MAKSNPNLTSNGNQTSTYQDKSDGEFSKETALEGNWHVGQIVEVVLTKPRVQNVNLPLTKNPQTGKIVLLNKLNPISWKLKPFDIVKGVIIKDYEKFSVLNPIEKIGEAKQNEFE